MGLYFEIQDKLGTRSDQLNSCVPPSSLPGFVLCHNYDWDDNGYHNWYCLHYFNQNEHKIIGEFHLMHISGESKNNISGSFRSLSSEFCSLGNDESYYKGLYNIFGTEYSEQVLAALQDCAVNVEIYKRFKDDNVFLSSLRRETFSTERILRLARFLINGRELNDAFSFNYICHPPYNERCSTEWKVSFSNKSKPYQRSIGVIGENGVGKTRILCRFVKDLLDDRADNFRSPLPIYSEIIAICSTPFDDFMEITSEKYTMPYVKCCLEQNKEKNFERVFQGASTIIERGNINGMSLMYNYVERLKKELPTENISDSFKCCTGDISVLRKYEINRDNLKELVSKLSSGQLHTLMMLTMVYENIYYDTLFVIDEPEVHLHPNAILSFSRLLCELLDEFHSYAIITTHSPLVVREMIGKNVYVIQRLEDNNVYISHCENETFGEDIAILYRDIFGYDDSISQFRDVDRGLAKTYKNYDEVIAHLGIENVNLAGRFIIRAIVDEITKNDSVL